MDGRLGGERHLILIHQESFDSNSLSPALDVEFNSRYSHASYLSLSLERDVPYNKLDTRPSGIYSTY